MFMNKIQFVIIALFGFAASAQATDYRCDVDTKFDSRTVYTQQALDQGQFHVLVEDRGGTAHLSRCSFVQSEQAITCDRYDVDHIEYDDNVRIKKYYVLRSQFDVQIFADLFFVENNGRAGIAFGQCTLTSP